MSLELIDRRRAIRLIERKHTSRGSILVIIPLFQKFIKNKNASKLLNFNEYLTLLIDNHLSARMVNGIFTTAYFKTRVGLKILMLFCST